jgi:hypothetical protein
LADHEPDHAEAAGPDDRGVRVSMVKARWAAKQRPGLPDAREWSTTLALALTQSLLGQRPVAQLNRWVVDEVLVGISMYQRRSVALYGRVAIPAAVRLFGDGENDNEVNTFYVNSIQFRDGTMTAEQAAALGAASADGIPIPPTTTPSISLAYAHNDNKLTLSWDSSVTGFILQSTDRLSSPTWSACGSPSARTSARPTRRAPR